MKSRLKEVTGQLEAWKSRSLETSGAILAEAYRKEIVKADLIDTGALLNSITHHVDGDTVYAGTPISEPFYPYFQEVGYRHHQSGELLGGHFPLTKGAAASEAELRSVWATF